MRALVIYESMFGNTRAIAGAIAQGLAPSYQVHVLAAGQVEVADLHGADLIVAGGPTHVRGLSRPSTREGALKQASAPDSGLTLESGATGPGLRELLGSVSGLHADAAAFDTRVAMSPMLSGRASKPLAHALRRCGCRLVARSESFLVTRKDSRLLAGEEARARDWGAALAAQQAVSARTDGR